MKFEKSTEVIYKHIQNYEYQYDQVSSTWLEKQFILLLHLLELKLTRPSLGKYKLEQFVDLEWGSAFNILYDLCYVKKILFSDEFVAYFEIWATIDDDPERLVCSAYINDFCLSKSVYEHIKNNKSVFQNYWEGDCSDLWMSATYLFEKYKKKPFSVQRYKSVYG